MQTQSEKNRTLSTIDIIESFIKKEIEDKGFIDSISSYKEIINNIENTLGLSDNINPMIKLDKLAEFVRILQGEKTKKKIFINPLKKQIKNIEKQLKKSERTLEERREKILKQRARLKEKHKLQAYRKMLAQKKEAILVRREKINKQAQSLRKLEKQLKK